MTERLHFHFSLSCIGEGNVNPLQCSCLENPRDRGAWWVSVYGVAQSWTRLTRLSSSSSSRRKRDLKHLSFSSSALRTRVPRSAAAAAAAAAAKSRQSCPTLCDPRNGSPPGSPVPGILQATTLEWVAIAFSKVKLTISKNVMIC